MGSRYLIVAINVLAAEVSSSISLAADGKKVIIFIL